LTDGVIAYSESARASILRNFDFSEDRVWVIDGAVDLHRFDPTRELVNMRPEFGLEKEDFVVGVVARIQPYRRFDALLGAMRDLSQKNSDIKLLIVGRGSKMNRVAVEPVAKMRLGDSVKFAGYHKGDDYVATLACLDAKIFLVPGTDGTCRAVREAMAMGKPVVAARRGILPEIVDDGINGLVVDDTPENIAKAFLSLVQERKKTEQLALNALKKARERFGLDTQADNVAKIYGDIYNYNPPS
jgi:glycosyltransferase involved in cell wall biosynthesis